MDGDEQHRDPDDELTVASGLNVALAIGADAAALARAAVGRPVAATAVRLLRLGARVIPGGAGNSLVADLAARGEQIRDRLEDAAAEAFRRVLRRTVEAALAAIDLTGLVRAHVDLDEIAAGIDVDAVVARVDVDAVVARVDVDAVVARADLDAVVERMDLDAIVARVDLDAVVKRIDLDAIVARVDVDRIASRIDLDAIVQRVDPDVVVARVDVEAVLARLDLAGISRQVIDAIDLPEILRQSTGVVSSQAARTVRTEGMNADDTVSRFVDRVLRRPHAPGGALP